MGGASTSDVAPGERGSQTAHAGGARCEPSTGCWKPCAQVRAGFKPCTTQSTASMYHQIARANDLREEYERKHDVVHHTVMRARAEMYFDFSGGWRPVWTKQVPMGRSSGSVSFGAGKQTGWCGLSG